MSSSEFVEKSAAAGAGITGHMILDNMLQRTLGKKLSTLTIPAFIIALSVYGGYQVSEMIDPAKGKDRFTYAIMNPKEAAVKTGAIAYDSLHEHIPMQTATPMTPIYSRDQHQMISDVGRWVFLNLWRL